jgi:aldehyde:ferredoxin oxidoreductase
MPSNATAPGPGQQHQPGHAPQRRTPPKDHWKKRFPELEKELLDTYYAFKGWNEDGIPTKESLHELGLDYVAEEFIEHFEG